MPAALPKARLQAIDEREDEAERREVQGGEPGEHHAASPQRR
jgi:hypothetical protein